MSFGLYLKIFGSNRGVFVRRRVGEQMISACGGSLLVTLSDLFRIQGTLNQHGYDSILQQYAIPSSLRLVGLYFVFQQDNDPTHLQAV